MRHPAIKERGYRHAFQQLRSALFWRYFLHFYGAVLLVVAAVCALVWPSINRVMLLILVSTSLAVCIAVAEQLSRRRAQRELSARGVVPEDWRPPWHELF